MFGEFLRDIASWSGVLIWFFSGGALEDPQQALYLHKDLRHGCQHWRKGFIEADLLLPTGLRKALVQQSFLSRPTPNAQHASLIKRYPLVKRQIAKVRRCFLQEFQQLRKKLRGVRSYRKKRSRRKAFYRKVERTFLEIFQEALLPLWLGTPWHLYGTAERPHQKPVACGYFVINTLVSMGFVFPERSYHWRNRRDRMKVYEFAKAGASDMAKHFSHKSYLYFRTPQKLKKHLQRHGPGLYLLGLSFHVAWLIYDGKQAWLWHSDGRKRARWVKREPLFQSKSVKKSKVWMLARLKTSMYLYWFFRKPLCIKKSPCR